MIPPDSAPAAEPEILSVEQITSIRDRIDDGESVVYESEWAQLCDSHERLRAEVAAAREDNPKLFVRIIELSEENSALREYIEQAKVSVVRALRDGFPMRGGLPFLREAGRAAARGEHPVESCNVSSAAQPLDVADDGETRRASPNDAAR